MNVNPIDGLLVGWIPLVVGILLFILAWGLWTLRPWAYWVTLILEIVNIVLHFFGYNQTHSLFAIISGGIIFLLIFIYLLVEIGRAHHRTPVTASSPLSAFGFQKKKKTLIYVVQC